MSHEAAQQSALDTLASVQRLLTEAQLHAKPVLTAAEALAFVGFPSTSSMHRWLERWAPKARVGRGRYARVSLIRGMERESRHQYEPNVPEIGPREATRRKVAKSEAA